MSYIKDFFPNVKNFFKKNNLFLVLALNNINMLIIHIFNLEENMDIKTAKAILILISKDLTPVPDQMGRITSNLMLNEFSALISEHKYTIEDIENYRPDFKDNFKDICLLRASEAITTKHAKELLAYTWENPYSDIVSYLVSSKMLEETDLSHILHIVKDLLINNMKVVDNIKNGKTNAVGFFVGQTMKAIKGKGNPAEIKDLILEEINKLS